LKIFDGIYKSLIGTGFPQDMRPWERYDWRIGL